MYFLGIDKNTLKPHLEEMAQREKRSQNGSEAKNLYEKIRDIIKRNQIKLEGLALRRDLTKRVFTIIEAIKNTILNLKKSIEEDKSGFLSSLNLLFYNFKKNLEEIINSEIQQIEKLIQQIQKLIEEKSKTYVFDYQTYQTRNLLPEQIETFLNSLKTDLTELKTKLEELKEALS